MGLKREILRLPGMRFLAGRAREAGLPPGTLVAPTDGERRPTRLRVFAYGPDHCREEEIGLQELNKYLNSREVVWLNIDGLGDLEVLEVIGRRFGIHELVLEDVLNIDQRPKVEEHEGYLFVVLKMLSYADGRADLETEQVSMILQRGRLITFQERAGDVFDLIRERIRKGRGRIRTMGAGYLAYALMDAITDNYFVVMERLGEEIEVLESEVLHPDTPDTSAQIHRLRRKVIALRRSVWPLREIISGIMRTESTLVEGSMAPFLRDLYDHSIQVAETAETFRDMLSGLLDVHLTTVSNRMNEVMKVLTMIATVFIPLSFMAGLYGMNFQHMPELKWRWGYPVALIAMALVAASFVVFFKKKKWL